MQTTVLLVVLPLLFAPLTALCRNGKLAWALTLVLMLALSTLAIHLMRDVLFGAVIHYELGGWAPPWGIEYKIDSLNALVCVIVTSIGLLSVLFAKSSVEKEISEQVTALFYACLQLCVLGMLGIALTGDIFNLFVFLEISSLSSYALIAMGRNRKALTAALEYLILGTIGATFFLLGVGMLYAASGSLNMQDIARRFADFGSMHLVSTSLAFIVIGIALKAAIFPLHSWLPKAYSQAPSVISIFLAATATKVSIYVIIRCLYQVYPVDYWSSAVLPDLLTGLGCIAIVYGSARALTQTDIRNLLAYSSVAQIGYMILGIGLMNVHGLMASFLHLFNHAIMKAALFMAAGVFFYRANTTKLSELAGLGKEMPWTTAALIIAGLSLIGMPGTVGFVSKWYLLQSAFETGVWYAVIAVLAGSVLAILYVWKMVEALYFRPAFKVAIHHVPSGSSGISRTPAGMLVSIWLLVFSCIYFGIDTRLTTTSARTAVATLSSDIHIVSGSTP
ncbi:monovalent cation/H+ antiporter subunit D family protein [Alteromonas aestuariivivens]|uniref:Monovalent cation/H+ antiporter subunit D family protein n=1 Tax=Alteromonas aestuariivivens TaxID=1938339 RepID=A0A3D8M540_9ALTE|nr:monovalent cation/H+ antiporter subunit D family protein [Alteromonas aestuariivivens]RDV24654.1 monovalent cation/H+ antiporter subunit D family protein [Alteromonas aestuariivivens]